MKIDSSTGLFTDGPPSGRETDVRFLMWCFNKAVYEKHGIATSSLVNYAKYGMNPLLDYYEQNNQSEYSSRVSEKYILDLRNKYEAGEIKKYYWKYARQIAVVFDRYVLTKTVDFSYMSPWGLRQPIPEFKKLLDDCIHDLQISGRVARSTIRLTQSAVRGLLFIFEDKGFRDIKQLGYPEFTECITEYASRFTGGLGKALYCVNLFLAFIYRTGDSKYDLRRAIPQFRECRKKSIEGFNENEIARILASINTETPIGKRDFAAIVLALQTSLRAVDIVKLRREDINWHTNELKVIQSKTGRGVTYPLLAESGNAIADYLLHGRPTGAEPYVFVTHHSSIASPLTNEGLIARLRIYMKKAGISNEHGRRLFHSLRRTTATHLLDSEVPLEMLEQVLGQTDYNSAKPYLSVNECHLKLCGLSFPKKEDTK